MTVKELLDQNDPEAIGIREDLPEELFAGEPTDTEKEEIAAGKPDSDTRDREGGDEVLELKVRHLAVGGEDHSLCGIPRTAGIKTTHPSKSRIDDCEDCLVEQRRRRKAITEAKKLATTITTPISITPVPPILEPVILESVIPKTLPKPAAERLPREPRWKPTAAEVRKVKILYKTMKPNGKPMDFRTLDELLHWPPSGGNRSYRVWHNKIQAREE